MCKQDVINPKRENIIEPIIDGVVYKYAIKLPLNYLCLCQQISDVLSLGQRKFFLHWAREHGDMRNNVDLGIHRC